MFDYAAARRKRRIDSSRVATTSLSIAAHILVIAAVAIPALYATDALPQPPTMLAFVVDAAPPPPPPPPPPAAPGIKAPPSKNQRSTRVEQPVARPRASVPAPVEAPTGISPETGLESDAGTASRVAAGFERGVPGGVVGGVIGAIDPVIRAHRHGELSPRSAALRRRVDEGTRSRVGRE